MRYRGKTVSCVLVICLFISAVYTYEMTVASAAGNPKVRMCLKIDNQTVSGKTVSIKSGKKKKIKVTVPKNKSYKITFRSNKRNIVSVSKTGKITAKRVGSAKVTVAAKSKKKKYKSWIKVKVVSSKSKSDDSLPAKTPVPSDVVTPSTNPPLPSDLPTTVPSDMPMETPSDTQTAVPSVSPTVTPSETPAADTGEISDMYDITIQINDKSFPAKLYQTETTDAIMEKLPLSITMNELNGNEKYFYFSDSFPTEAGTVSQIRAGDLKLYGSSCLVLFYESFATSYSYTSLGYVANPEGLAEALGKGNVNVLISQSRTGE